jgi:hypothetical protein
MEWLRLAQRTLQYCPVPPRPFGTKVRLQNAHARSGSGFTRRFGATLKQATRQVSEQVVRVRGTPRRGASQPRQVRTSRIPRAAFVTRVEHSLPQNNGRSGNFATSLARLVPPARHRAQENVTHSEGRRLAPTPSSPEAMVPRSLNQSSRGSSYPPDGVRVAPSDGNHSSENAGSFLLVIRENIAGLRADLNAIEPRRAEERLDNSGADKAIRPKASDRTTDARRPILPAV